MHIKLSEYQAKSLYKLFNKNNSKFCQITSDTNLDNLIKQHIWITKIPLVLKVDQYVKRRGKLGLVAININYVEINDYIKKWSKLGYNRFILEPCYYIEHEYYICIQSKSDHDELLFHINGGIHIGDVEKHAQNYKLKFNQDINFLENKALNIFATNLYKFYQKYHFTYLEINPIGLIHNELCPLDFAAKIDSTALYLLDKETQQILSNDFVDNNKSDEEKFIEKLDAKTGASLKFTLLNPTGSIWTLIAGGGASVVYTDAIVNMGYSNELANYGEYSGNPSKEYTYLYVKNVFTAMFKHNQKKKLYIGGGIANFTDIAKTFEGIVQGIEEFHKEFIRDNVKVYVRRGGPNYKNGLKLLKNVCEKYNIPSQVFGPEVFITNIVKNSLEKIEIQEKINNHNLSIPEISYPKLSNNYDISNRDSTCFIYGNRMIVGQRMYDFDNMCNRKQPSVVAFIDTSKKRSMNTSLFWKNKEILVPIVPSLEEAIKRFPNTKWLLNYASFRSAYKVTMEALHSKSIQNIAIIAEGIPENLTRNMNLEARKLGKMLIGPATVGGIKPGCFRIGNTCGSLENLYESKLYQQGSVAFVTKSGGLLNEMCRLVSLNTDGVYECVSIGGDRYPGSNMIDHIYRYEKDPNVKMIMLLGEVGGKQELIIAQMVQKGLITKPVIGWCIGTSASYLADDIQFGHAGASAHSNMETAKFKNRYMKHSGIFVPDTFEDLPKLLNKVYIQSGGITKSKEPTNLPPIPMNYKKAVKDGLVRRPASFFSSISNETGDELTYNGMGISKIIEQKYNIGHIIGLLWFKKNFSNKLANYISNILMLVADHGPCTSGAQSTIIAARSNRDMVSSVSAGLLMISDRFGGALNKAGKSFYQAVKDGLKPQEYVDQNKKKGNYIMGIGHRYKSATNPDSRVTKLKEYIFNNYHEKDLAFTNFALEVEKITLQKRNNLILNVDGFLAVSLLDCFINEGFTIEEIEEILELELLNGFFIFGRTCGYIGHWIDQKRLKQPLYRCDTNDVTYLS